MNEYNKALEIDTNNVEALVARGALWVHSSLSAAERPFTCHSLHFTSEMCFQHVKPASDAARHRFCLWKWSLVEVHMSGTCDRCVRSSTGMLTKAVSWRPSQTLNWLWKTARTIATPRSTSVRPWWSEDDSEQRCRRSNQSSRCLNSLQISCQIRLLDCILKGYHNVNIRERVLVSKSKTTKGFPWCF